MHFRSFLNLNICVFCLSILKMPFFFYLSGCARRSSFVYFLLLLSQWFHQLGTILIACCPSYWLPPSSTFLVVYFGVFYRNGSIRLIEGNGRSSSQRRELFSFLFLLFLSLLYLFWRFSSFPSISFSIKEKETFQVHPRKKSSSESQMKTDKPFSVSTRTFEFHKL